MAQVPLTPVPAPSDALSELVRHIKSPALVAITGGGGKTTLMFALARCFRALGARVVVTTTTKIFVPSRYDGGRLVVGLPALPKLGGIMSSEGLITLGSAISGGKLIGISAEYADKIYESGAADYIIAEADGARGMPFKAYEQYEPVMPSKSTFHIVVAGAEIFKEPLSDANTFRFELLRERWGAFDNNLLPNKTVLSILESRSEYLKSSPDSAERALMFNKCDLLSQCEIENLTDMFGSSLKMYDYLSLCSLKDSVSNKFVRLKRAEKRAV